MSATERTQARARIEALTSKLEREMTTLTRVAEVARAVAIEATHAEARGRTKPARTAKVGRNEPCPCGSGRKFKKCCGSAKTVE